MVIKSNNLDNGEVIEMGYQPPKNSKVGKPPKFNKKPLIPTPVINYDLPEEPETTKRELPVYLYKENNTKQKSFVWPRIISNIYYKMLELLPINIQNSIYKY